MTKGTEQDEVLQAMKACAVKGCAKFPRMTVTHIQLWMDRKIPKPAIVNRLRILEKHRFVRRADSKWMLVNVHGLEEES